MTVSEITIALEPFRQVHVGLNRSYEGTGLGLSLASRYMALLEGKLEIQSNKQYGTTVSMNFPDLVSVECKGLVTGKSKP